MSDAASDAAARALARWLVPYIAEELSVPTSASRHLSAAYDEETCREYAEGLGLGVVDNAVQFFEALARHGSIGSVKLAEVVGVASPRQLAGVLTTSLKRRARTLGLPQPWNQTEGPDGRTVWRDRDGISQRMVEALRAELEKRDM